MDRSNHYDFYLSVWPGVAVCRLVDTVKVIPGLGENVKAVGHVEGDLQLMGLTAITKQCEVVALDVVWLNQFLAKFILEDRIEPGNHRCSVRRRCARRKAFGRRMLDGSEKQAECREDAGMGRDQDRTDPYFCS